MRVFSSPVRPVRTQLPGSACCCGTDRHLKRWRFCPRPCRSLSSSLEELQPIARPLPVTSTGWAPECSLICDDGRLGRWYEEALLYQMAGDLPLPLQLVLRCSSQEEAEMPFFDFTAEPEGGPKAHEILSKRKTFLNPALFLYYKKHILLDCGLCSCGQFSASWLKECPYDAVLNVQQFVTRYKV